MRHLMLLAQAVLLFGTIMAIVPAGVTAAALLIEYNLAHKEAALFMAIVTRYSRLPFPLYLR